MWAFYSACKSSFLPCCPPNFYELKDVLLRGLKGLYHESLNKLAYKFGNTGIDLQFSGFQTMRYRESYLLSYALFPYVSNRIFEKNTEFEADIITQASPDRVNPI